jgi:hypothetical protein
MLRRPDLDIDAKLLFKIFVSLADILRLDNAFSWITSKTLRFKYYLLPDTKGNQDVSAEALSEPFNTMSEKLN